MTTLQPGLLTIFDRFPDHREAIELRIVHNDMFKTICEDYGKCLAAIRHWSRSEGLDAEQRRLEYGMLLKELEEEILDLLTEPQQ